MNYSFIKKCIMIITILLSLNFPALAGVLSFDVLVPDRFVAGSRNTISIIDVTVDVMKPGAGPSGSTFTITQPGTEAEAEIAIGPGGECTGDGSYCHTYADNDKILITPDPHELARFKIRIFLDSNVGSDPCNNPSDADLQTGDETWTFSVAAPFEFVGACVVSYERTCPGTDDILPGDVPATIVNPPDPNFSCVSERPAVDVMLVLDKSGSMGWSVTGALPPKIKMDSLHEAVQNFVGVWDDHETSGDQIGVVLFNQDASNWTFMGPPPLLPGLNAFTDALSAEIDGNVSSITAGGSTSIGDGLVAAANHLVAGAAAGHRQIILLMSDGMQNTERLTGVAQDDGDYNDDGTPEGSSDADGDGDTSDEIVITYNHDGSDMQALPGIDNLNIWSVTVGAPATDIDPTIFTQIASTGLGYYVNSEVDPDELNLFFLELLQNFLRFSTIETTRLISDEIPIIQSAEGKIGRTLFNVATSSTAKKITFCLMWDPELIARPVMEVAPPQGEAFDSGYFEHGPGFIRMTVLLPLPSHYPKGSHIGDWTVNVFVRGRGLPSTFPFQFYALVDDDVVKSATDIENKDYVTDDPIPLRVSLREFGLPILNPDNTLNVFAKLIKPEDGIGNLLAEISAEGEPPVSADQISPVDFELYNYLQQNPDALQHISEIITLYDDGSLEHGDMEANDGIYSNLYTQTQKQGHYNFLFAVEGPTQHTGPISRQHIETVYVRLEPDPNTSDISGQVVGSGEGRRLQLSMTPRDKFGNMFGPGYQNYFIISPIHGRRVKFQDPDLDGVYTLDVGIPDTEPIPPIQIQYVKPFIVITDEMVEAGNIPADLQETFVEDFDPNPRMKYLSLHGGLNIPHADFADDFDGNVSLAADFEYELMKMISLLFFFGYNRFDGKSSDDLDIYNVSLNGKFYLARGILRPFLNAGAGNYWFDPNGNDIGFNLGGGLQWLLSQSYGIEGWYNYHNAFRSSETDAQFSNFLVGLSIRF